MEVFVCLGFGHFILFVGQCKVFVVLDLVILFYLFIFFLGHEAQKVREWGVNSLKTSIFPLPTYP